MIGRDARRDSGNSLLIAQLDDDDDDFLIDFFFKLFLTRFDHRSSLGQTFFKAFKGIFTSSFEESRCHRLSEGKRTSNVTYPFIKWGYFFLLIQGFGDDFFIQSKKKN